MIPNKQTFAYDYFAVDPKTVGQLTGLVDKNGKEIYEGDKVKHKYRRIWQTKEHISTVVWDESFYCYYLFDGQNYHRMRDDIIYEIIGNIYEA